MKKSKRLKYKIKRSLHNFFTITPTEWKKLQKTCITLSTAAGLAWGAIAILPNMDLNGWDKAFAGFIAAMVFVTSIAQSKTEKNVKTFNSKNNVKNNNQR